MNKLPFLLIIIGILFLGGTLYYSQRKPVEIASITQNSNTDTQNATPSTTKTTVQELDADSVMNAAKGVDFDGDGYSNYDDNCPEYANPDQKDSNHDGIGDLCSGLDYIVKKAKIKLNYG